MPGLHDIKRQINSIKATQQITSAMELVAASRMKRAQDRALGSRPYTEGLESLLRRLLETRVRLSDPLLSPGKEGPVLYVLITGDRGLCGGYNTNLIKLFSAEARSLGKDNVRVVAVGKKGRDFVRRAGFTTLGEYSFPDSVEYVLPQRVAADAVRMFLAGEVSEVRIVYNRFISTVAQKPSVTTLLPVSGATQTEVDGERIPAVPYILEPSPQHLLSMLLPKFIAVQVQKTLFESKAGELGARMIAMGSATDNAQELIDSLSLKFNRERQAAITREISEIVGGANALK